MAFVVRRLFGLRRPPRLGRAPDWLPHEAVAFEGNTGALLAGRWFPAADPRGMVVLAHPHSSAGQHWFVLAGWVDFLHDQGFHVLTFDFAGYGTSRGGSTYLHEDVIAACRWARNEAPGLPLHLVGVSLGAFAAANASPYLAELESLTLESPYPNFNRWYRPGVGRAAMWLFDRLLPRTRDAIQADQNLARAAARRILVAASAGDRLTPTGLSQAVARAAPPERTRYEEFAGTKHRELLMDPAFRAALLENLAAAGPSAVPPMAAKTRPWHRRLPPRRVLGAHA